jgi:hypothetical protein
MQIPLKVVLKLTELSLKWGNFKNITKKIADGQESLVEIDGEHFVMSRATGDDMERINKGYFVMD